MSGLRIGVAGLGTVGGEVLRLLIEERGRFTARGVDIQIAGVCARNRNRERAIDIRDLPWFDDPVALARDDRVDVLVELMGGADGPARACVDAALEAGKAVVTANKALVAEHGAELALEAERRDTALVFEAAVAGGLPIIKTLKEGIISNNIIELRGILNGTCNFILSTMSATGRAFDDVLLEAQRLGYAEADPTLDVGGFDAAHKIAILAAMAFGGSVDFAHTHVQGIENVSISDMKFAQELGRTVKLISLARNTPEGIEIYTEPCLVSSASAMAQTNDALNAIETLSEPLGSLFLRAAGAGAGPTASAVLADIVDLALGNRRPMYGWTASEMSPLSLKSAEAREGRFYLRLSVNDRPGGIASATELLAAEGISIDTLVQHSVEMSPTESSHVPVVIVTHACRYSEIAKAAQDLEGLDAVASAPVVLRIED